MKFPKVNLLVSGVLIIAISFGMIGLNSFPQGEETPSLNHSSLHQLARANNVFGFRLLKQLVASRSEENVFTSPLSIHLALGMTHMGARSETGEQMAETLGLNDLTKRESAELSRRLLNKFNDISDVDLSIANSIWARKGLPFKKDFLETGKNYYRAKLEELDFDSPETMKTMNDWVKQKTKGKIERIIERLNPLDVMVLLNAIYFKGKWASQFKKENTTIKDFWLSEETEKPHPMMRQSGRFPYLETQNAQIIQLPYEKTGQVSAYVVLPKEIGELEELIADLDEEKWRCWNSLMERENVELTFPKFSLRYEKKLNDPLKNMGMELAFDNTGADLTGIIDVATQNAYISQVKHKTFLEVNERGTEAAAATSVKMTLTSAGPPEDLFEMVVDHPFLFAIGEKETGTLLFLGGVWDPGQITKK